MLITEAPFTLRKWTVKEYHKLGEMGVFHPEERVELLSGNIITISAKGTAHTSALGRTDRLLQSLFGNLAWVGYASKIRSPSMTILNHNRISP